MKNGIKVNYYGKIMTHLLKGFRLTTLSCQKKFGTTELRKYISIATKRGYVISRRYVHVKNRYGNPVHIKEYFL